MISFDTNILLAALEASSDDHQVARQFLEGHQNDPSVAVCELVLLELYTLLRNPKVCERPLSSGYAATIIQAFRHHPNWRLLDYASAVSEDLWAHAAKSPARLRIYDIRLALTLRHHGVTDFATRNVKDFQGFGFKKVWDPLA